MSTPRSETSSMEDEQEEFPLEFNSPEQVEELLDQIIEKHEEVQMNLEVLEATDDDVQELRELEMDRYQLQVLAEAYDALGETITAQGSRNQAEECDERISELQSNLENMGELGDHFYNLYKTQMERETLEIKMNACMKYLEKHRRKAQLESKKEKIRPASPRRYAAAQSPSRLAPAREVTPPREATPPSLPTLRPPANPLPLPSLLPVPSKPMPEAPKVPAPTVKTTRKGRPPKNKD